MDRRSHRHRFVPQLDGSLEDRTVLTAGVLHAHVSPLLAGSIPILSKATNQNVINSINSAFNSYRGQSQLSSVTNSLWNSMKNLRWNSPDSNKPNDFGALRTRVMNAVSMLPYGAQQLAPTIDSELGTTAFNKAVSHRVQNQVLRSVHSYVQTGFQNQTFLQGR